ncbi:DUF805 domain-containing protein [Lactovum odontotermitis]
MATKKEWTEYFEMMNNRQASSEEVAAAIAAGEIELSPEEIDAAAARQSAAKPSREAWLDYFEMINGRKPSLAEFQAAQAAGEFSDKTSPAAQQLVSQPAMSQAFQSSNFQPGDDHTSSEGLNDAPERVVQPDVRDAQPTAAGKVGFFGAFKLFFKNYVNFKGRSSRSEFWYVNLGIVIIYIIAMIITFAALMSAVSSVSYSTGVFEASLGVIGIASIFVIIIGLALIVPAIAITVRRFRDAGISHVGYIGIVIFNVILAVLGYIPFLGIIARLAEFALLIYIFVIEARPSDYFRTHKEPITDWIVRQFGKK